MRRYPALRALIILMIGFAFGAFFSLKESVFVFSIIALATSALLAYFKQNSLAYFSALIASGVILSHNAEIGKRIEINKICPPFRGIINGKIVDILGAKSDRLQALVEGELDAEPFPNLRTSLILTIKDYNEKSKPIKIGDKILVTALIKVPQNFNLESDFQNADYAQAMKADFIATCESKKMWLKESGNYLEISRGYFNENLKTYFKRYADSTAYPFLLALLAGDRSEIPTLSKKEFALSGAAHILSIGGLHIGLIAIGIYVFLGFIKNRWVKFLLFSILTLAFTFYSGWSPPAQRAAFMAIAFVFVKTIYRKSDLLNIVGFSTLLMIVIDPTNLSSMSFLLSVGSIAGIIFFYPKVYAFLNTYIFNKYLNKNVIVTMISATISAGIIIAPFSYYFKSYSIISPLTNLIVVPSFNLGMIWGMMGVLANTFSPFLGDIFAKAASLSIHFGVSFSSFCANLPISAITGDIAFVFAIALNIGILYVIYSNSGRLALYRSAVVSIATLSIFVIFNNRAQAEYRIVPREECAAIELRQKDSILLIIADRKPKQIFYSDNSLIKNYSNSVHNLKIAFIGNNSKLFADSISKGKNIQKIPIDFNYLRYLKRELKSALFLPQEIEIKR